MYQYEDFIRHAKVKMCGLNGKEQIEVNPKINLYIRVTDLCNAACPFCAFHSPSNNDFDINGMIETVKYLRDTNLLSKVQITGGEPTCNDNIVEIVRVLRELLPNTFIGMNSNGSNVALLTEVAPYLSNIALSRHAIEDEENRKIFNNSAVMSTIELVNFMEAVGEDKIHLSCTLMKSHVGDKKSVEKYLRWANALGVYDVGFVTLMPCNDFAKKEQVYFEDIGIEEIDGVKRLKIWSNRVDGVEVCCCANFEYKDKVKLYARYARLPGGCTGMLVYDVNKLYAGFKKEEL